MKAGLYRRPAPPSRWETLDFQRFLDALPTRGRGFADALPGESSDRPSSSRPRTTASGHKILKSNAMGSKTVPSRFARSDTRVQVLYVCPAGGLPFAPVTVAQPGVNGRAGPRRALPHATTADPKCRSANGPKRIRRTTDSVWAWTCDENRR